MTVEGTKPHHGPAERLLRLGAYVWAAPWSLVGMLLGASAILFGASPRLRHGAIEVGGGALIRRCSQRFCAITLGHVILGRDHETLDRVRAHEQVHVRQYERWGPFFIPAYVASSLVQLARSGHPYRDNRFEREARALSEAPSGAETTARVRHAPAGRGR